MFHTEILTSFPCFQPPIMQCNGTAMYDVYVFVRVLLIAIAINGRTSTNNRFRVTLYLQLQCSSTLTFYFYFQFYFCKGENLQHVNNYIQDPIPEKASHKHGKNNNWKNLTKCLCAEISSYQLLTKLNLTLFYTYVFHARSQNVNVIPQAIKASSLIYNANQTEDLIVQQHCLYFNSETSNWIYPTALELIMILTYICRSRYLKSVDKVIYQQIAE